MNRKIKTGYILLAILLISSMVTVYYMGFFKKKASYDVSLNQSFKAASPILIGAAVDSIHLQEDQKYKELFLQHYDSMVSEFQMKMKYIYPHEGEYRFEAADFLVTFAEQNNISMHGHTLIWHLSVPDWIQNFKGTDGEFEDLIKEYIMTVVGRYKGRIDSWDVVNEAFTASGYRDTIFYQRLGPNYISKVFQWAHEADPDAKLYYNDYKILAEPKKRDFILTELTKMINEGVPIHGLGIQSHLKLSEPSIDVIRSSLENCSELGIDIRISELDVSVNHDFRNYVFTDELAELQKQRYHDLIELFLQFPQIKDITTWGVFDGHTWKSKFYQPDWPLLFDKDYNPKPAAEGFLLALQGL